MTIKTLEFIHNLMKEEAFKRKLLYEDALADGGDEKDPQVYALKRDKIRAYAALEDFEMQEW